MKNLISIIVPVYNLEKELPRCLDSILAQSYEDIEVIPVDDGSQDGSQTILEAYAQKDSRVKPIFKENGGVTSARLAGIAAATGEWIGFVDGDDYIEPDMYQRLLGNALQYEADISHCGYRMVFADGRVNWFHNTGRLAQQDKLTGLSDLLDGSLIEPGLCNKLFRKNLLHSLFHSGALDPAIRINEDLLMNYVLFSHAERSVFEDFCPYHYIVRGTSASRAPLNEHRLWDPIRVKQRILDLDIPGMEHDTQRAYLSTCVNVYNGLMLEKDRRWRKEETKVRQLIRERRDWEMLLSNKQRLLTRLILTVPGLYRYLYRFYAKYVLVNRYA